MRVALFVPCYVDQFYPQVAMAALKLLEKSGCEVDFPLEQTCCGQPMANSGCEKEALSTMQLFIKNFSGYDYIVAPSGSCVLHVKEHYSKLEQTEVVRKIRSSIFELCEFFTDVLNVPEIEATFPYKVGLLQSCHGQRGLNLSKSSELTSPYFSKTHQLLDQVTGLKLVEINRTDECCGFGGTFCVSEEAVSVKMGKDRISDFEASGAQVITGGDMSCLMHLEGIIKRQKKNIKVVHIAELLNGTEPE
jgi:L-lactate dehydrogenase complex protein LldE